MIKGIMAWSRSHRFDATSLCAWTTIGPANCIKYGCATHYNVEHLPTLNAELPDYIAPGTYGTQGSVAMKKPLAPDMILSLASVLGLGQPAQWQSCCARGEVSSCAPSVQNPKSYP